MLVKLSDKIKKIDNLKVPHRGRVVFNEDPNKRGRIKCQVKGIFETSDVNILPWITPYIFQNGTKPDSMHIQIPELESEVVVFFPYNNVYAPFYVSGTISELTKTPSVFDEDYPNTEGWINSIPSFFRINKTQKTMDYYNDGNGFCFRVDGDGNLFIKVPKSLILEVGENFSIKVGGNHAMKISQDCVYDVGTIHEIKATSQGIVASTISHEGTCLHATGVQFGRVAAHISELESKISELESKISELSSLAQEAKSASESNKSEIAKVD